MPKTDATNADDIDARIDALLGLGDEDDDKEAEAPDTVDGAKDADAGEDRQPEAAEQQQPASTGTDKDPSSEPPANGQAAEQPQQPSGRLPANQRGDLVDAQGNVVARAGNERRFYETAQRYRRQLDEVAQHVNRLETQVTAFREAAQVQQQLGLQPQEVTAAMQFLHHWKNDPVAATRNLLTEVRAMGHSIEDIGPAVDTAAIRQIVQAAVAPFVHDRQSAENERQIIERTDRELAEARTEFPWLDANQTELAMLMDADARLTLREAALHLENYALRNGFDLSKSVNDQRRQREQPARPATAAAPPQHNNARVPAPNAGTGPGVVTRRAVPVDTFRSNRDIVRETLREHGLMRTVDVE